MTTGEDWQGKVGEEWAQRADVLDGMLGAVGLAGLEALGDIAGRRVLDLGCGAGASTRALGAAGAKAVGLDLSAPLIEAAKARDPGGSYVLGDAAAYIADPPFDALFSRFGVMFFDEPVAALTHIRQQLHPGAPAVMLSWCPPAENEWAHMPIRHAGHLLPPDDTPPATGPGPFAWADPAVFHQILGEAGWSDIAQEVAARDAVFGAGHPDPVGHTAEFFLSVGPLARRLRGADPALRPKVVEALRPAMQDRLQAGAVHVGAKAWVISARA